MGKCNSWVEAEYKSREFVSNCSPQSGINTQGFFEKPKPAQ